MEVASQNRYSSCPTCAAKNMGHRKSCYRCRSPLGEANTQRAARSPAQERKSILSGRPIDHRRMVREPIKITDVLIEGEVALSHRATVLDASINGIRMRCPVPIRVGASVRLNLPLDGRSYPLEGKVRYRASVPDAEYPTYIYGIKLDQPSPALRRLLMRL